MPIGTAVHARSLPLCESLNIREWSGYYAVSSYETHHEHEYNAIRSAAALIDVSPLFKYLVTGRDAVALVDRIITRDAHAMAQGQVYYTPWCDTRGRVIDDGTVTRIDEQTFRWTAADPSLRWFIENAAGLDVVVEDVSDDLAALALQGPTSAAILQAVADVDIAGAQVFPHGARPHRRRPGRHLAHRLHRRSGLRALDCARPRDRGLGRAHGRGLTPTASGRSGMLALDVARTEAGLLLIDVDFHGSRKALIESHTYSPFELGLGRLVQRRQAAVCRPDGSRRREAPGTPATDRRAGDWMDRGRAAVRAARHAATAAADGVARRGAGLQERPSDWQSHDHDLVAVAQEADCPRDARRRRTSRLARRSISS